MHSEANEEVPHGELLSRIAMSAEEGFAALSALRESEALDASAVALVRFGAAVAIGAPDSSIRAAIDAARGQGLSGRQMIVALAVIVDIVGEPRVAAAAPKTALALGYDIDLLADLDG